MSSYCNVLSMCLSGIDEGRLCTFVLGENKYTNTLDNKSPTPSLLYTSCFNQRTNQICVYCSPANQREVNFADVRINADSTHYFTSVVIRARMCRYILIVTHPNLLYVSEHVFQNNKKLGHYKKLLNKLVNKPVMYLDLNINVLIYSKKY